MRLGQAGWQASRQVNRTGEKVGGQVRGSLKVWAWEWVGVGVRGSAGAGVANDLMNKNKP